LHSKELHEDGIGVLSALGGSKRGLSERDNHVDLVRLFLLCDAPASAGFKRDGPTDREPDLGVPIDLQIAALDQFIEIG
jgi:hypothetical protein